MSEIKNIIFDLGGVIINLDVPRTIAAFNKLSNSHFEAIYTQLKQTPLFDLFDKGLISEDDFFDQLKVSIKTNADIPTLKEAWNAMLLDFPGHRLELLKQLKPHYRLFLLSNTNETHIAVFEKELQKQHGYSNIEPFFEKVYYSCRMKMRKPDEEIFNSVLTENNLVASETVFIDDTLHHIEGAKKTGINAQFLAKEKEVAVLIHELNLLK